MDEGYVGGYGEDSLGDGFAEAGETWRGRGGGKAPALILEVTEIVERHIVYPIGQPNRSEGTSLWWQRVADAARCVLQGLIARQCV